MPSSSLARRRARPSACPRADRLRVEQLEERHLLSTITFTAPSGNGLDDLLLTRNGNRIELYRIVSPTVRTLLDFQNLNGLTAITINGASGEDDRLTIDFAAGGLFSVRDGITFNNAAGVGGTDRLTVICTNTANNILITTIPSTRLSVDGSVVFFSGVEQLQVNALAGADSVTMTGMNPTPDTTIDAGVDSAIDRFTANFAGNFGNFGGSNPGGNLTLLHFDGGLPPAINVQMRVGGHFNGHWIVTGSGTVDDFDVGGDMTPGSMAMAEDFTSIDVMGAVNGMVIAEGSGTIEDFNAGSIGSTGVVMTEEDLTSIMVMGNMDGTIVVGETLGTAEVGGSTSGTIAAGDIETLSATEATATSPVLKVIEGGVLRMLVATRADNGQPTPFPASVKFKYFYDSTGTGDPRLIVQVTNGSPSTSADDFRFDLSLVTDTVAEFDLARLFANGTSGIRNVAVEGDVLSTVSPAALAFFGLPAGTPGGVRLPLDALGAVAAQDNLVAGTLQVASLMAVAFGSLTTSGSTIPGEAATHVHAASLLAPGSSTVTADTTGFSGFLVPFSQAQKVAFFLDTGPGVFDVRNVLFTDQMVDTFSLLAGITVASGTIKRIDIVGNGGSIQTDLPIIPVTTPTGERPAIISTGPLGDLTLSSSQGIGDVTAPSIFGNINTNGPIFGTILTTVGDLGRVLSSSGTSLVTTVVNTNQGITGRIISRGSVISRVVTQREFSGVIAAQLDIGAYEIRAGQLVRGGGIFTNGQLSGQIVALGNILGDIDARSGLTGRVAAKGRAIAGLAATRIGILGNFRISGNIEAGSAIVSAGVIGDAAGGTFLDVGTVKGILAAKVDINARLGNTQAAAIFEPAPTPYTPLTPTDAAAIDAIFTQGGVPLDIGGLALILADLAALRVGPGGNLTGPVP